MHKEEEKRVIIEKEQMLKAYDTGEKKSKQYTEQELEEKKRHYLSMIPKDENVLTVTRWKAEVERCFMRKSFKSCPDKYFYHLDTFLKYGM